MAQAPTPAVVSGTVTDPTDAVIVHAGVHLFAENQPGKDVDQRTDREGRFRFRVPPGTYTVRVATDGFEPYNSRAVVVGSGAEVRLPVRMVVAGRPEQLDVSTGTGRPNGADDDGQDLVFDGNRLNLFSDDPVTLLHQISALAGGAPGGPQIIIDGLSNGRVPPKSSIRSIRINRNPYSAYYDTRGLGRVEIETKPGTDKLHGELDFAGTDQPLNARNPYTNLQPPYYQFQSDGNISGPLNKKTAFFLAETVQQVANNAIVNAVVLDPLFLPATLSQALPAPQHTNIFALRLDRQFSANNFGYVRNEWTRTRITNSGIEPLVLPSAAFNSEILSNALQASDTQILGPHAVNQARFQYVRSRVRQDPDSTGPTFLVEGSFEGGGSPTQSLRDKQDRYEFQDQMEFDRGKHSMRTGFRYRALRDSNASSSNFNGEYVFANMAAYQITQQGLAAGLDGAAIRAQGGGASQFAITTGQPNAVLYTGDLGLFGEDDWKISKNLTLSYGLRIESQSGIPDHFDPAPRIGVAWTVRRKKSPTPVVSFRGGYGVFYERFPAPQLLQAARQNGTAEIAYFAQNPDFYPAIPPPSALTATEPTTYQVSPNLRSSYAQITSLSASRMIGSRGTVSAIIRFDHGTHDYLTRNINAPRADGTRPLGTAQNIYQYSSDSNYNDEVFSANASLQVTKRVYVFGVYVQDHERDEGSGAATFPSNQYNLKVDYAHGTGVQTNRFEGGLIWNLPMGLKVQPFLSAHSGAPFDITTGTDLNGDTLFNDRPAFASDLSRASVVRTPFGNFDTAPLPGQRIIPRNYGSSPGLVWLDLQASKEFGVGPRPPVSAAVKGNSPGAPGARADRPWHLRFQVEAQNILNHDNPGLPIGVLTSPYFGHSLSLANDFSPLTASNRTILLQSFFTF